MFKILRTQKFIEQFQQLPKQTQEEIKKLRDKLKENPFVGDPLGFKFFREKKFGGLRLYFLVYEDIVVVLFVALSDKKTQQSTIDEVKLNLKEYWQEVHKSLKDN